jgi:hypothetical protein
LIRTSYPVPPMAQMRLRWELAMRRTRRTLEQRRRSLAAATTEAPHATAAADAARGHYLRLRWREDLKRERAALDEFTNRFDGLVGLICVAAQEGLTAEMEQEFLERRRWFIRHYPQIKGYVAAHLTPDASDTISGRWGRRSCDAFEAMFSPASLSAMLENDGGNLIGRLCRTQAALTAWEESLGPREAAAPARRG